MRRDTARFLRLTVAAGAVVGLGACGSGGRSTASVATPPALTTFSARSLPDPGLLHIHGLGVSGGRLYIATHTGMWVADRGERKATRFGISRQDVMGFSVVRDGQFLGSGHPAPGQRLPPNLGLIRSGNEGGSWQNVSLRGQADFHVLVSQGRQVYGYDGTRERLMVSRDGGRRWVSHGLPPLLSLAIDPDSPDRFVASTDQQLFTSTDAGRSLGPVAVGQTPAGFLAWPRRKALYVVGSDGVMRRSANGGRSFTRAGSVGGTPSAFIATGSELYVALDDASVRVSRDGGRTWTVRTKP